MKRFFMRRSSDVEESGEEPTKPTRFRGLQALLNAGKQGTPRALWPSGRPLCRLAVKLRRDDHVPPRARLMNPVDAVQVDGDFWWQNFNDALKTWMTQSDTKKKLPRYGFANTIVSQLRRGEAFPMAREMAWKLILMELATMDEFAYLDDELIGRLRRFSMSSGRSLMFGTNDMGDSDAFNAAYESYNTITDTNTDTSTTMLSDIIQTFTTLKMRAGEKHEDDPRAVSLEDAVEGQRSRSVSQDISMDDDDGKSMSSEESEFSKAIVFTDREAPAQKGRVRRKSTKKKVSARKVAPSKGGAHVKANKTKKRRRRFSKIKPGRLSATSVCPASGTVDSKRSPGPEVVMATKPPPEIVMATQPNTAPASGEKAEEADDECVKMEEAREQAAKVEEAREQAVKVVEAADTAREQGAAGPVGFFTGREATRGIFEVRAGEDLDTMSAFRMRDPGDKSVSWRMATEDAPPYHTVVFQVYFNLSAFTEETAAAWWEQHKERVLAYRMD
uniref:Uncharacterized protein n=1 Tax=Phaeomonas parva TaxID=124430 RepID=A0A7S1U4M2_9STRA|mmetsp:Transcript_31213/g.99177  ORF Transcript_31213/g.99177 Transcript_31213/m.99177 type:complete len:502 (+) Transcript_31213:258-1763(+)|eukprot:CAMPEP_0118860476 /NCGR_PEP_ID=MMETSP1163-20130328/6307_1 /TAXON_ID=124430 /ORGANISM="Phaeomonas parva, Strain CCMP2877" /LENGTH=501 /DNA_ID=CAMNT_0006794167 /DNA_START=186 /DNA_END=1691 /DNA_ORIENTATION=-